MALYELRTYTLHVDKMTEAVKLYQEIGFPALQKGGSEQEARRVLPERSGMINQLLHLWKFDDDADRRGIGPLSSQTMISSKASPRSSVRC
jgi:NIPSNAP